MPGNGSNWNGDTVGPAVLAYASTTRACQSSNASHSHQARLRA
jgi:hypothetical protein